MSGSGPVLILGGTREARDLVAELVRVGVDVVSSLAGRVSRPALPVGKVRTGGFGGPEGLAGFIASQHISAVVDATHPFAATISANAASACGRADVPLVRLQRPGWERHQYASEFVWVNDVAAARAAAEGRGRRPFVTTGRQQLHAFAGWDDRYVLVRVVERPDWQVPSTWRVLLARGPYSHAAELTLLREHAIDVLLTKDSGGPMTEGKLAAAHDLGVPVIVVSRPSPPHGVLLVERVAEALAWVTQQRAGAGARSQ